MYCYSWNPSVLPGVSLLGERFQASSASLSMALSGSAEGDLCFAVSV
jgi:hypothetical protein